MGATVATVRRLLAPLDIGIGRLSKMDPDLTETRRVRFLEQESVSVVIDVGAHVGTYGCALRDHGYTGRIESFEPLPSAYDVLRRRPWNSHRLAVGAENATVDFHVSTNQVSSSVLPILPSHLEGTATSSVADVIKVDVVTLDSMDLVGENENALLKVDVQGYESAVLDGAAATLSRTRLLEIELSLIPLYRGQMLYQEMTDRLGGLGFELIWVTRGFQHPATGRLLQMDGIFARS